MPTKVGRHVMMHTLCITSARYGSGRVKADTKRTIEGGEGVLKEDTRRGGGAAEIKHESSWHGQKKRSVFQSSALMFGAKISRKKAF